MRLIKATERLPSIIPQEGYSEVLFLRISGKSDAGRYYGDKMGNMGFFFGDRSGLLREHYFDQVEWMDMQIKSELEEKLEQEVFELKTMLHYHPVMTNIKNREGISIEWRFLWSEIENWYGDPKKSETGEQFLRRMQRTFELKKADYEDYPSVTDQLKQLIKEQAEDQYPIDEKSSKRSNNTIEIVKRDAHMLCALYYIKQFYEKDKKIKKFQQELEKFNVIKDYLFSMLSFMVDVVPPKAAHEQVWLNIPKPKYVRCPDGGVRQVVGFDTDIKKEFVFIDGAKCFIDGPDYVAAVEPEILQYLTNLNYGKRDNV